MSTANHSPATRYSPSEMSIASIIIVTIAALSLAFMFNGSTLATVFVLAGTLVSTISAFGVHKYGYTKRASTRYALGGTLISFTGGAIIFGTGALIAGLLFTIAFSLFTVLQLYLYF